MALREDIASLKQRLANLGAGFDEALRKDAAGRPSPRKRGFLEAVFGDLHDLFTQGVTSEGLHDLLRRDARDTLRYYSRWIDFESLRRLPWYRRYPATAWKIFVALAYRLSPPRRLAFAVAIFLWVIGWIQLTVFVTRTGADQGSGAPLLLVAFLAILLLLLMELRDKLDLKGDLEIAREIQFGLVPSGPFHQNGTSIDCFMRPANTVGGDYCDIIQLQPGKVAIVIGDVAGKGMPAALMMALLQGSLRTLITAGHRGAVLLTKLNAYLFENLPDNKLVTLFYGELDTSTGQLSYVNAGHNAPVLLRKSADPMRLPATSLVLGIERDCAFEVNDTDIQPEDRLLLFTDGITEAFNPEDREYGEPRLIAFVRRNNSLPPNDLIKALVGDVLEFCGTARIGDDITVMVVSRGIADCKLQAAN